MCTTNEQNSDDNTTKSVLQTSIKNKRKTTLFHQSSKLDQKKKNSSSSKTVGKCLMEAQQTYNATLWMTKSLSSTTEGGRSLRKPTLNSKCNSLDE